MLSLQLTTGKRTTCNSCVESKRLNRAGLWELSRYLAFSQWYVLSLDHAPLCKVHLEPQPSGWRKHTPPPVMSHVSGTRATSFERSARFQDVLVQTHSMCIFTQVHSIRLPAAHACGNHRVRQAKSTLSTNILVFKKAGELLWGCRQAVACGSTLRATQP